MKFTVLSDNKSDNKNSTNIRWSRYVIVQEEWCSDELIKWLLLACGEKCDGCNVARPGNSKHICVMSTCSKDKEAVHGLPENCYNPKWLGTLRNYKRKQLNI